MSFKDIIERIKKASKFIIILFSILLTIIIIIIAIIIGAVLISPFALVGYIFFSITDFIKNLYKINRSYCYDKLELDNACEFSRKNTI